MGVLPKGVSAAAAPLRPGTLTVVADYAQIKPGTVTLIRHWEQATKVNIKGERVTLDPDGPFAAGRGPVGQDPLRHGHPDSPWRHAPVSLGDAVTGIDDRNVGLLVKAVPNVP